MSAARNMLDETADSDYVDNELEGIDGEEDANPLKPEQDVKAEFDQVVQEARKLPPYIGGKVKETDTQKNDRKNKWDFFVECNAAGWKKTCDGGNFLHYLAYYKPTTSLNLDLLTGRAIIALPEQMGIFDDSGRTPLTVALSENNALFVRGILLFLPPATLESVRSALKAECIDRENKRGTTSLLTAITSRGRHMITSESMWRKFIKIMPDEMFTVTDSQGCTPLHLAVDYERCCNKQITIVKELLLRAPQALKYEMRLPTGRPASVYQYHMHTRKQSMGRMSSLREQEKKSSQVTIKDMRDERASNAVAVRSEKAKGIKRIEKGSIDPALRTALKEKDLNKRGPTEVGLTRKNTIPATAETEDSISDIPENTSTSQVKSPSRTAGSRMIASSQSEGNEEREAASTVIIEQIKLFFLRTQKPDYVNRSLHFDGEEDKELWFDFGGPTKRLGKKDFKKHFDHLNFNSVLQYVAFPQIVLGSDEEPPKTGAQGRTDLVFFFEWLRNKGVKQVVKIIVDDLRDTPHSDEAIEESLESMSVEILDWRRTDLDSLTLRSIGENLRILHLQWSGSNPVLRAWSEREGLCTLPKLQEIHITQVKGIETDKRIEKYLDDFKKRLEASWSEYHKADKARPPTIHLPRKTFSTQLPQVNGVHTPNSEPGDRQQKGVDMHKWMQCMEEFASRFQQIEALRLEPPDPFLKPVEIALIDDGADITHPDLRGMKIPGKSFHHYQEGSTWRVSPYWNSASNHGTLMARLIHRICPSAIIHIIKLETFPLRNSTKLQINTDSVIEAIKYASDIDVQIISMSWTIKQPEDTKQQQEFVDAVHIAINIKKILMFCAASDQGKSKDSSYPHDSNTKIFRIGAAKATGSIAEIVGDEHELSFIFPGHELVIDRREDFEDQEISQFEAHSGSSVATALATGLAALIFECVRLGVWHSETARKNETAMAITKDDLDGLRVRDRMESVLKCIGLDQNTNYKYIEVWKVFPAIASKLEHCEGSHEEQLEILAGLAFALLKKGFQ
ncbi:hypothetical protein CFAM422_003607 [Trichoderma lentiforme]|uniref:Peptidase S8/S53 domain-containing protein n=1 Tax=Trichoderma lentiforme TaxID=1567552 RepID=A0A9P4XME5_9HYPO|nr:hypothetical protein CFAM422_003607 [Trichoderma lentiforme]